MKPIVMVMLTACLILSFRANAQEVLHVENEFIKIIVGPEGFDHPRFSIETTGGDPSRIEDDQLPLIYGRPKPWTSYTTIAIDNAIFGFGTQTVKRAGKKARYGQVISTKVTQNAIVSVAKVDSLLVTQRLSFFRNPLTNVEDSVLIEYDVYNDGGVTKNIGLRIMMDTMLGKNDAAPFRIGNDAIVAEMAYSGEDIMDYWQSFDSLVSPNIIAQGILRHAPASLTPPDQLILMNWGALADNAYRVKVKKGRSFIREGEDEPDTAVALLYDQEPLAPKRGRSYRTVMGLGGVSLVPGDLSLGLTVPTLISVTDPTTYTMVAYISNTGGFTAKNADALIELPTGMVLVTGNQNESLGDILPGGSRQLVYFVKMDPKNATEGKSNIKLTVRSSTLDDQVIQRKVTFTGQPKLVAMHVGHPKIQRGFDQFVDIPVEVKNESDVMVSNIELELEPKPPFSLPLFEFKSKVIDVLAPRKSTQISWKLKANHWHSGTHNIPIKVQSAYTKSSEIQVPVTVTLGVPEGRLYYSDQSFYINDYGYLWLTLSNMPTFSGLNLRITWDPDQLKPIRVSPEPWLIESMENAMDVFVITENAMEIKGLAAKSPPWRMIIGKWHFKAIDEGDAVIKLWQGDQLLDDITLVLRRKESRLKNEKEENNFDF